MLFVLNGNNSCQKQQGFSLFLYKINLSNRLHFILLLHFVGNKLLFILKDYLT